MPVDVALRTLPSTFPKTKEKPRAKPRYIAVGIDFGTTYVLNLRLPTHG